MGARECTVDRMRVVLFSATTYEISAFERQLKEAPHLSASLDVVYVPTQLERGTVSLTSGAESVCLCATDYADSQLMQALYRYGVRLIVLRYVGYSNVDVDSARQLGIIVANAPPYAATSIAEYTVTLMLALNRKVHIANNRVRDGNFTTDGLIGFDISGRTVGIIGTNKVGEIVTRIMRGFGCRVLAYDMTESQEVIGNGGRYVSLRRLLASSDILSIHAPLVSGTYHMIRTDTLAWCKRGVHIINTSRGGLIDVKAIIDALCTGQVGGFAMDIHGGEYSVFYRDLVNDSGDPDFRLLKSLPNVLITGHQAPMTTNGLATVAKCTIKTLSQFQNGEEMEYALKRSNGTHSANHNSNGARNGR